MTKGNLRKLISRAPTGPGIYIFTGPGKKKLYIGKASNIKIRLSSYTRPGDQRLLKMLSLAKNIRTVETDSEIEALILESQYIKKHKPAFNITLRDDKQFFYAVFTREKFPKIFLSHQPHESLISKSEFIGPFIDGTALKTTLRYLRRIFPYCTCKRLHNNFCLNYHMGKCPGFCCLKQPEAIFNLQFPPMAKPLRILDKVGTIFNEYRKNIRAIKETLSGKKNSMLKKLEKEMVKLGEKEKFEEAVRLRDKLEKLKKVFENARIIQSQNFPYYAISKNNSGTTLSDLKKVLNPNKIPVRIEGYDVANIQGKYAVGAMVVFTLRQNSGQANWEPNKDKYRRFRIRNSLSAKRLALGDTAMLKEILSRRFNHLEWLMPDLILVDGGKAQLNATHSVICNFQFPIKIIALTKNKKHKGEKIFISGRKKPIPISQLPKSVKNLLLHINSEAHRFAVSYHRWLHRKAIK